jgi:TonB family protein
MYLRPILLVLFGTLLGFGSPFSNRQTPQDNENPKVVEMKAPTFPAIARSVHAFGSVVVEVDVEADGKASSVRAISGHPLLLDVSRNAARGWRFEAAPNGASIRRIRLTFDFDLETVGCNQVVNVAPYHLRISAEPPPDTVSYIPDNAEEMHCKLHGTRLLRDKVEIRYGLIGFQEGYLRAEKKLFPEANSVTFGGCVIEAVTCDSKEIQLSPRFAEVLYCPVCRRAQAKWTRQHSHNPIRP